MEKVIDIIENIDRTELFGNLDINLKLIKEVTGVDIIQRDNSLILMCENHDRSRIDNEEKSEYENQSIGSESAQNADSMDLAERTIRELMTMAEQGESLDKQKVNYVLTLAKEGISYRENRLGKDVICFTHQGKPLKPKTIGQKAYVNAIRNKDIVFGVGPAGTGKTYIAVAMAINAYKNKDVQKIILARPAVEAGERLGFLPGDLQEKVDPYLRPLYDALYDVLGRDSALRLKEKEVIEVVPLAYMRGRTLDNSFIILDEAQNATREQMKMFLTRMGFGSKVVVTGDVTQIDLPRGKKSGLVEAINVLKNVSDIDICYLKDTDVVRHELVRKIINAYDAYYKKYPDELNE